MRNTFVLISLFLVPSAQAARFLSLEEVVYQAWENSPQLHAQEDLVSVARMDRVRRFIPNEPTLSYGNADSASENTFGVQLTMGFPGKNIAFNQLDTAKLRAQESERESRKYDLARIFTQGYLDCASATETLDVQKTTSEDLQTIFQSLKTLYEAGHSTQAEKIGAELQARQAGFDLKLAEDRKEVACHKLQALIETNKAQNDSSEYEFKLPDDLDEHLISELNGNTADQSRSKAAMAVAGSTASTAFWGQLPDLTFSFNRNQYVYLPASPNGRTWTNTYGVAVTFPLLFPFYETLEARRTRSQAVIDENAAQIQNVAANADQRDGAREYLRSKARLKELRQKDLAMGEALVDSTYSAYRSGKLGYAELVLSRKTLNDLRLQDVQLRQSIINAHLRCLNHCNSETPL